MKKERLYWIDRVKFLACVFIMLAHFQDAVLDACALPPAASPLYTALNNFLAPLETGKCWVIVFCILSGFLSCREVRSFRELAAEGLTRWLRFFLPLLAVNALAFVLLRTGRMYHGVYGERFGNSWLLGHYTGHTGARDVLIQSAILGSAFNGPLWMLRPLFLGNLAVLTVSFLGSRLPEKFRSPLEWAAFGLLLLGGTRSVSLFYMAVTFSGLLIARTRRAVLSRKWIPAGILVPWLSLYLPQLGESFAFVHSEFCYFLLGLILVVPFFYSGYAGCPTGRFPLGGVSFWVYVLHFPVELSLGLGIVLRGLDHFFPAFALAALTVSAVTVCTGYLLTRTFDRRTGKLVKGIKERMLGQGVGP